MNKAFRCIQVTTSLCREEEKIKQVMFISYTPCNNTYNYMFLELIIGVSVREDKDWYNCPYNDPTTAAG